MSAIKPSIYNQMIITSSDGREADFRFGAVSVDIYEDIFSPSMSAKIQIANVGGSIKDEQGTSVTLYEGMKIRGGEPVRIQIASNSSNNEDIDFLRRPLFVRGIKNLMRGATNEFFILNLVPREATVNEHSFLQKTYSKDAPISDHVRSILTEYFPTAEIGTIDKTLNKLGFQGNQMKPFEGLLRLASKSVPAASGNSKSGSSSSAGYFFYQTRDGFQFRSIDDLAKQEPKATYVYSEVNFSSADFKPTPDLPSLDYKIISYAVLKNQDLLGQMRKGAYASERRFFDPISFRVSNPLESFTGKDYVGGTQNIGEVFKPDQIKLADVNLSFTELPSEILTEVVDYGTIDKEVSEELNQDIFQYVSQRKMRYNTLFTQIVKIQVPLNTALRAGDIIECKFPKITTSETNEFDRSQVSGLYMVKELCHHFDTVGSYSIMTIVRDTFGRRKK